MTKERLINHLILEAEQWCRALLLTRPAGLHIVPRLSTSYDWPCRWSTGKSTAVSQQNAKNLYARKIILDQGARSTSGLTTKKI